MSTPGAVDRSLSTSVDDDLIAISNAHCISVWAPKADAMGIVIDQKVFPLQKRSNGYWEGRCPCLVHGTDYFIRLDDRDVPDPRSPWQPKGVQGPSRHVDHTIFLWGDAGFQAKPLSAAVIYELHVGTFTRAGTFDAVIERLQYLKNLGITHLELMPVAEFLGDYGWGYDGVFIFAPHHAYGGPDGLKRLVNACHTQGIAVILDVVYNHFGPSGNCLPLFGPYLTQNHATVWGDAVNFDGPDCDEVRRFFLDNAAMWLRDYHIDGLRLDAIHAIVDNSALHFLEELALEVDDLEAQIGKHLVLIAESDLNDPRVVRPAELGGFGLDAQWSDDIHHALHAVLTGECTGYYADFGTLHDLATAMARPFVYAGDYSQHRKRSHGRQTTNIPVTKFVAFSQNHDQLGNRAVGERLCHLTSRERAKIAAALVLLSPYIPLLFQGEEWSASAPFLYFADFESQPKLAKSVELGRQQEFASFGWQPDDIPNPADRATFETSKLDWNELSATDHREMLEWYRALIRLRAEVATLFSIHFDRVVSHFSETEQWLWIERGSMLVVCNLAVEAREVPVKTEKHCELLLASKFPGGFTPAGVILPPESIAIYRASSN